MDINKELNTHMQTIRFLDKSTDDYFYLYDLINDRICFTDRICSKYPLPCSGKDGIPLSAWGSIVYPRDRKQLEQDLSAVREGREDFHCMEYRLMDREGNRVWISCRGTVRRDENGKPIILIGTVSELAAGKTVDSLTGLWNSDKFMEDMRNCLKERNGYLMVLGIDNFKHINVKNGRTFGNYILKQIAEVLEACADYSAKLYRLAGDCFAVNFPETSREVILEFYENVKKGLEKKCTVSAGVVEYSQEDGIDSEMLYQYAENALDRAKKEGKNMLAFFSSHDYQKSLYRIELLDELKASVKAGFTGFYLCYQPQLEGRNFKLYGAEALLRYQSSVRGVVGPGEFIPLLEQSGLICQVGQWVLKTAVRQCVEWRKKISDLHINVNISYVQLRQEGICSQVLEILQEAGLPGEALTLEVTESMQLQDYPYFNKIFYEWKNHGIQIAIDDFGTGYSSLSYLKSMEIDETKIDRCFVSRIQQNAYNYRLLDHMIQLAHSSEILVCCEGVETEEELRALKKLNPDVLQGFLFARPYKKEQFERVYMDPESPEFQERLQREMNFKRLETVLEELEEEKTSALEKHYREILEETDLGLWEIRIDLVNGRYEMYADPVMRRIMGIEEELSPKDCYTHWYNRINDGYYSYVNMAVESSIKTGKLIQVEYTWNHPTRGEVTVRCMTIRAKDKDGMICLEGYHRIISDLERPDFLPQSFQSEMFEFNEKKGSIYFHTKRQMIAGNCRQEKDFPECWIRDRLVHPHFAQKFRSMFQNVQEKKDSVGEEMMFQTKSGSYKWFRVKTGHLSSREEDANTIAVLMDPADQERAMELEYMKKSDFYEAVLSETVAHAEVDIESGRIMEASGLWSGYKRECKERRGDFEEFVRKRVREVVFGEDEEVYQKYLNLEYMKNMCRNGIPTLELCFRRYIDQQICWVKLVVHVFQDRFTENLYALVYLKNIDAEKRRELAQESTAQRDPLTGAYNRTVFQREVTRFMTETEDAKGALILWDLDDFKKINDEFGHLRGDEILKELVGVLKNTFRSGDLVGRFGGDEFLVFVKGVDEREILDKRMEQLFYRLKHSRNRFLSCSAGVRMVEKEGFSYEEELRKADFALYKSKEKGKHQYSYYEE